MHKVDELAQLRNCFMKKNRSNKMIDYVIRIMQSWVKC